MRYPNVDFDDVCDALDGYFEGKPLSHSMALDAADMLRWYKTSYDNLLVLRSCHTCDSHACGFAPEVGDTIRINCPHWKEQKKE